MSPLRFAGAGVLLAAVYYAYFIPQKLLKFSVVPGYFDHKTEGSEMESFFATAPDDPKFGLTLPSFRDLHDKIEALKAKGRKVKVLYLLRHAEGYHNEAEKELNDREHWFGVEGKHEKYTDADLNAAGIKQSEKFSSRLGQAAKLGIKVEHLITSPLRRAVRTAGIGFNLTAERIKNQVEHYKALSDQKATAEELARETMGELTCDKRLKASELSRIFPWVDYKSIVDEDIYWKEEARETIEEKKARVRKFLQWLWTHQKLGSLTYLVVATHSGWINAALRELKVIKPESKWKPANAQMMGLVVEADELDDEPKSQ